MSVTMRKRSALQIEKAVLFALLMRELKTRFGGKLVGLFWVLFEPVANIYILLLVRGVLRTRLLVPTIQYPLYHVIAMIPYFVFRSCWFRTMEAVSGNQGLFAYRQVKPFDAMIARCTGAAPRQRGSSEKCRLIQPRRGALSRGSRIRPP